MSIVITGATGGLGRATISHLLSKNVSAGQIVAVVRDMEKAADLGKLGVELRLGDYNDPASMQAAFAGAEKLFFIPSPDFDNTLRVVQHANVVKAARDAGVKHIAYAGYAFAEEAKMDLRLVHLSTEFAIRTTGIPFTFLRNGLYHHLFVNPGLKGVVAGGEIVTNAGTARVNSATRSDLAMAAAVVLTTEGHENKTYNLVSPEPWTFDELAEIISEVSGKNVVHRSVPFAEAQAEYVKAGLPEPVAAFTAGMYAAIAEGETAKASDDLKNLIGSPTSLRDSVKEALQG